MTHFRGPVTIGGMPGVPSDGSVRHTDIDVSGTAVFRGPVIFGSAASSGAAQRFAVINVSGTADFSGPVRDVSQGGGTEYGTVMSVAFTTVTGTLAALASNLRLPVGALITDAHLYTRENVNVSASGAAEWFISVGSSGDADLYMRLPVSATGFSRVAGAGASAAGMLNVAAAGSQVHLTVNVQTTLSSKDLTTIDAVLVLHYVKRT